MTKALLDKAHALEVRGRMDMAAQTWQQVLLTDPNNTEALGGLARSAKLDGNTSLTNTYLGKLRSINPNDPNIARVEGMGAEANQNAQLQEAGKLAEAGQYIQAMAKYRLVFGTNPPAGDGALAYYETESATEDGRPHAIAGLRALVERYPADSRYQIALGRILTYNPRSRAEGRKLLEKHPKDPRAVEALRQSLLWDSANPATAGEIRAYLAAHRDPQLAEALRNQPRASAPPAGPRNGGPPSAATAANRARSAEEIAAYRELNQKHIDAAEKSFRAILAKDPENPRALAGMGYVRMRQSNFSGAISYLEQARHDSSNDPALGGALDTSRFWFTMGEAQLALNENDLTTAEKQYRAALALRPAQPDALEGLGGTLLKAQQPQAAVPVFENYVKVKPASAAAWRGLFTAQYAAENAPLALATQQRIPSAIRAELMRDPDFLRTLASAYSAAGRDADAARVLQSALDLPFPEGGKGLKSDTRLQYAGLLLAANRMDQAAALYRQVLADDHDSVAGWQGLVRVEHAMAHDPEALQSVESMPPATYAIAMKDPGFQTTVASIYQNQKKLDIAQDLLEKSIASQTNAGQKPSLATQMQLAGIYLQRGDVNHAYPIYQQVLTDNPQRTDAWIGVLSALHSTGRDRDAVAELQIIPPAVRTELESNVQFLQTAGAIYDGVGNSRQSLLFLNRVQQYYAAQHTAPPASIDIQNAWLLYNGMNDAGLYRQLMNLGGRSDLTDEQRLTVQTIWTNWAVRRANQAVAAGNPRRSLAILNATAHSFPDNPAVIKALANGYARAGQPGQAVLIYKAQDMSAASPADYQAAVGAALAANDIKAAEQWLRYALAAYPGDPQILILGAKFEQARGDSTRAIDYYHASLRAMPASDPGAELAAELSLPAASMPVALPSAARAQDLSTLLAPGTTDLTPAGAISAASTQPYLPSYGTVYGVAPVVPGAQPSAPGTQPYTGSYDAPGAVPPYMTNPLPVPTPGAAGRLKDYGPQSGVTTPHRGGLDSPRQADVSETVDRMVAVALGIDGPLSLTPRSTGDVVSAGSLRTAPSTPPQEIYGAFVPYVAPTKPSMPAPPAQNAVYDPPAAPVAVQLGRANPHAEAAQAEATDVLPTARYAVNARAGPPATSSHPDIAAAQAASIRRRQSDPGNERAGQSKPPAEDLSTSATENVQYKASPQYQRSPSPSGGNVRLLPQPSDDTVPQAGVPDTGRQQYPRPRTESSVPPTAPARRATHRAAAPTPPTPAAAGSPAPAPQPPVTVNVYPPMPYPGSSYPGVSASVGGSSYPDAGPAYPLAPGPGDSELMARNLPALGGSYDRPAPLAALPLSPRAQAELDLSTLEGSYSGWVGGAGIGRYRSGTPGLDRLYDIEAPIEASVTFNQTMRLTVVPKAVFLNSGVLNTGNFVGATDVPYLGTLPANAVNPPAQQFSNGVGGELQLTTRNIGLAAGYTPYEFLVANITGRFRWRPLGDHFTLFGDRDSVKDTQLSYAGLRDPGSVSLNYPGNIWGGVVSTGGGARFDLGSNGTGFYISGDGGVLTGYHVLDNTRFEGSMGAYFRAKSWPQYGTLTVGGALFGMHYGHNELGLTYGQGGYFSPSSYFLASVPVSFAGFYGPNFHYSVAGAIGVQTFQQDSALFYPLDPALQTGVLSGCTLPQLAAHNCGEYPISGNTGFNYGINAEGAYRIAEHWYAGGFLSGNNTNNYNTVSGGFFFRYLFRVQHPAEGYPTGLFPVEGFRPVQVP